MVFPGFSHKNLHCLVVFRPTPLKNDGVRQPEGWHPFFMMENKIHVPNHQPAPFSIAMFDDQGLSFFTVDPTDLHPTMNFVVDGSAFLMPVSEILSPR